ncbi:terpene synthase family protein [Actinacidiphila glaucinigra]|uniref:terpene synthase family protein n=1 Tax=Actinacidiphila glaucinigra TaxID=235986 RepID=UPI0029A61776|nr:terpene synthase family protein [Streptomyces sp. PA03-3a]
MGKTSAFVRVDGPGGRASHSGTVRERARGPVHVPGPSLLNPGLRQVEPQVMAWARRAGLLSALTSGQAGRERQAAMAAHVWPWAAPKRLAELARLTLWMFAVDDDSDAGPAHGTGAELEAMAHAVGGWARAVPASAPPAVRVLDEVVPRVTGVMGPAWGDRFRRHLVAWIRTNQDMLRFRGGHEVPTPEAYIAWRRVSGATGWCFDLIEYAQESELPAAVWFSPACRALREAAADVIGWTNDLFSVEKELRSGETTNLVLVLRHHHGLTLDEAVDETRLWHAHRVAALRTATRDLYAAALAADLAPAQLSAVCQYADGIHAWARGFLDFSRDSARYGASGG